LGILFFISLLPYYQVPTLETLRHATLVHYGRLFRDDRVTRAVLHSLFLAVSGATAAMGLAAPIAYVTVKTRVSGRGALEGLPFLPWAFPGTALALGLLWAYVRVPAPLYATLLLLLLGYVTRFLPYRLRAV